MGAGSVGGGGRFPSPGQAGGRGLGTAEATSLRLVCTRGRTVPQRGACRCNARPHPLALWWVTFVCFFCRQGRPSRGNRGGGLHGPAASRAASVWEGETSALLGVVVAHGLAWRPRGGGGGGVFLHHLHVPSLVPRGRGLVRIFRRGGSGFVVLGRRGASSPTLTARRCSPSLSLLLSSTPAHLKACMWLQPLAGTIHLSPPWFPSLLAPPLCCSVPPSVGGTLPTVEAALIVTPDCCPSPRFAALAPLRRPWPPFAALGPPWPRPSALPRVEGALLHAYTPAAG